MKYDINEMVRIFCGPFHLLYRLTRLIQQVQYGLECNSAVAAQANLASAAGGITFHARGGFCSVNKGAFYLGAEHPQSVGVQLWEGEASVAGKSAAVAVNYSYLFGAQSCHIKQHVVYAKLFG